jgi:hypothetical protein
MGQTSKLLNSKDTKLSGALSSVALLPDTFSPNLEDAGDNPIVSGNLSDQQGLRQPTLPGLIADSRQTAGHTY